MAESKRWEHNEQNFNDQIQQAAAWNVGPRLRTNQEIKFCSHSCHMVVIVIVQVHDLLLHILRGRFERWPNTLWKTEGCDFSSTPPVQQQSGGTPLDLLCKVSLKRLSFGSRLHLRAKTLFGRCIDPKCFAEEVGLWHVKKNRLELGLKQSQK